jgi:hypothetical protein
MSRTDPGQCRPGISQDGPRDKAGDRPATAEELAMASLELAKRARAAGFTGISYLLETAALQAGTEAAARHWLANRPER